MLDTEKTKEQLLNEIRELRMQMSEWRDAQTKLLQLEEKFAQTCEQMDTIINAIPDLLFEVDQDGRIYRCHAPFPEKLYTSPSEFLGHTVTEVLPPDAADIILHAIHNAAKTGYDYGTVYSLKVPQGIRWFELSIAVKKTQLTPIPRFVILARDITERKNMENALRESNGRLQEALSELRTTQHQIVQQERLRALGQMASGIAHDFNNALTPILGYSDIFLTPDAMLDDKESLKGQLKDFAQVVHLAARDAAEVVRRLREFYRVRSPDEIFVKLNINKVIEEAILLTQPRWKSQSQAHGKNIQVQSKLQEVPEVYGNESELREVFTNLIFNAVDAIPGNGSVTLVTYRQDSFVAIEVVDTGTGMPEEVRRHCFEPFFTTKGIEGSGMGLAMVYGVVRRHEGKISLESVLGQGTTFYIYLPIFQKQKTEDTNVAKPTNLRSLRILVVDDEELVRNILLRYLTMDEHTVEVARNGKEGWEKFMQGNFDLVITDGAMPEMSGEEMTILMKNFAPTVPIILLTGFSDMIKATGEKPVSVDHMLGKPVTRADLREIIAKAIRY